MTQNDDDDDLKRPWIKAEEVGLILIAGAFLLGFIYLMFGPSPLEPLTHKKPAPTPAEVTIPLNRN
jgi:hypothetical protein